MISLFVGYGRLRFEKRPIGYVDPHSCFQQTTRREAKFLKAFNNKIDRHFHIGCDGSFPMPNLTFEQKIEQVYYFSGYYQYPNQNDKIDMERKILIGFKEPARYRSPYYGIFGIEYPGPSPTEPYAGYHISEGGQVYITYPPDFTNIINDKMRNAFYISMDEYLGNRIIIPEIYGMEYDIPVIYDQALKVNSTTP